MESEENLVDNLTPCIGNLYHLRLGCPRRGYPTRFNATHFESILSRNLMDLHLAIRIQVPTYNLKRDYIRYVQSFRANYHTSNVHAARTRPAILGVVFGSNCHRGFSQQNAQRAGPRIERLLTQSHWFRAGPGNLGRDK